MRFGWLMAAIAALWAMPASAVTIVLSAPDPTKGVHQKVTLTGLTASDQISAAASTGQVTVYWWEKFDGYPWMTGGNEAGYASCSSAAQNCPSNVIYGGLSAPAKAQALVNIRIAGNDIFVDWGQVATNLCGTIPEADRVMDYRSCGFRWNTPGLGLTIDVRGPSEKTFGYSVQTLGTFAVPEPATWASIILGFGVVGIAMRRRPSLRLSLEGL